MAASKARAEILAAAERHGWALASEIDMVAFRRIMLARGDANVEVFLTRGAGQVREATRYRDGNVYQAAIYPRERGKLAQVLAWLAVPMKDYGHDVERFNAEHGVRLGCRLGRTVGSDVTECNTHGAWVSHGVPALLRCI